MSPSDGDLFSLAGKVAVVTGGATGIGAGISRLLAGRGARVAVIHRGSAAAREGLEELAPELAVEVDLRDVAEIRRGIGEVAERLGRIDVLVNCAGLNVQQLA